ncbi:Abi family protein [Bifidobacteriaceae bacterium NR047]|nr:Abi family protein [Bifidobacteriaceae bacterium NR047]
MTANATFTLKEAQQFCGVARFDRYMRDANNDLDTAMLICKSNHELAGVLHEQIGYVEICVRNSIDLELRKLALKEKQNEEWTNPLYTPDLVKDLIENQIKQAREIAVRSHAGASINHDDILSKLMWGTWVKLVGTSETKNSNRIQQKLWKEAVCNAFPFVNCSKINKEDDEDRKVIAQNLIYIKEIRNKAAHFDNLYNIAKGKRNLTNALFMLLHSVNESFTTGWIDSAKIRKAANKYLELMK